MQVYYYKKKKRGLSRKAVLPLILVFLTLFVYLFIVTNVNPVLKTVSEERVRALTTVAVNASAEKVMGETFNYADIITITKDANDDIILIQVNTATINAIARKTVIDAQQKVTEIGEQGINVPVGSLSGIAVFAGKGPNITVKVFPVGSVTSSFDSTFVAVGINQTRHILKMIVSSNVSVVIPGVNKTVITETEVVICENIIIGKIPDVYINSPDALNLLDLVP